MKTQAQLVAEWNSSHNEGTEICLGGLAANHRITTCSPAFLGEDNLAYVNVAIEGVCETKWLVSEITSKEKPGILLKEPIVEGQKPYLD